MSKVKSSIFSIFILAVSTSNKRCDPPCRSKPKFTFCDGINEGNFEIFWSLKRFGKANNIAIIEIAIIDIIFDLEKCNIINFN